MEVAMLKTLDLERLCTLGRNGEKRRKWRSSQHWRLLRRGGERVGVGMSGTWSDRSRWGYTWGMGDLTSTFMVNHLD